MCGNSIILKRQGAAAHCLAGVTATVLLCASAQATLHLQEGFSYEPGTLGTNAPWANPTNLITVVGTGLSYPNLADCSPSGGAVSVTQGTSPSASVTYRPLDSAANSGSAYFSFVVKFASVPISAYVAGLLPPTVGLPNGSASDPCDLYVKSVSGGYNLGIRARNGTLAYQSAPLPLGTASLIVLKYEFTGGRASLYVNPSPGGTEPASPDASSSGITVTSLDHVYLRVSGSSAGSFLIDSLRVANTWEEVTPVGNVAPATRLVFASAPRSGTAGATLAGAVVQIQNETAFNVPSNNVPITLTLNSGAFATGTTTLDTDVYGRAIFSSLTIADPGHYTLTASASGIGAGLTPATSATLIIGSTNIEEKGQSLSVFLDSLQVERYWENGKSVNWLIGAAGGTGPYMTVGTASHCSAFAASGACLLGIYILRQPDASDLNLANNQADWLLTNQFSGWFRVPSPADAQHLANVGELVVASLRETADSGHIAILRPSDKSDAEILTNGPQECQSGIYNYNSIDVRTGFGQHDNPLDRILYYAHAVTNPIQPACPALSACTVSEGTTHVSAKSVVGRWYRFQSTSNFASWANVLLFTNSNDGTNFYCTTPLVDPSAAAARFYRLSAQ